jgi:hypothetical protein
VCTLYFVSVRSLVHLLHSGTTTIVLPIALRDDIVNTLKSYISLTEAQWQGTLCAQISLEELSNLPDLGIRYCFRKRKSWIVEAQLACQMRI